MHSFSVGFTSAACKRLLIGIVMTISMSGCYFNNVENFFEIIPHPAANLVFSTSVTSFNLQSVNSVTYRAVGVTNNGTGTASLVGMQGLTGTTYIFPGTKEQFTTGPADMCGETILPGASCELVFGFAPLFGVAQADGVTPLTATAQLIYFDQNVNQTLPHALTGKADLNPRLYIIDPLDLTAQSYNFGVINLGGPSAQTETLNLILQFYGPPSSAISNIAFTSFIAGSPYLFNLGTCAGHTQMNSSFANCAFSTSFAPTQISLQPISSQLSIAFSDGGSFGGQTGLPAQFGLSGFAAGPAALQLTSAAMVNFGNVYAGSTSAPQTLSFHYTGTLPVTQISASISGTDSASFSIVDAGAVSSDCRVASLSSDCQMQITFSPNLKRPGYAATFTLSYNDGDGNIVQENVSLTGNGIGDVSLTPAVITLASVPVGNQVSQTVQMLNLSTRAIYVDDIDSSVPASLGMFTLNGTNCSRVTLAPGQACSIEVLFAPTDYTVFTNIPVNLSYRNSDAGNDSVQLLLSGNGIPDLQSNSANFAFGSIPLGNHLDQFLTLTNVASSAINVDLSSIPHTLSAFTVSQIPNPTTRGQFFTLAAGASFTLKLTYLPTALGVSNASFSIAYTDAVNVARNLNTISLSGTGTADLVSSSLNFSDVPVGNPVDQTLTLQNVAVSPIVMDLSTLAIANTTSFQIVGGNCSSLNAGQLAALSSCTVSVQFLPISTSSVNTALHVNYIDSVGNHFGGVAEVDPAFAANISGSSTPDLAAVNGSTFAFGAVPVGDSRTQTLALHNLAIQSITVTNVTSSASMFTVTADSGCQGGSVSGNSNCNVSVTFTPTAIQSGITATANFIYTDAAGNPNQTFTFNMTGEGIANLTIAPTLYAFPSAPVGNTESASFTVQNVSEDHAISLGAWSNPGGAFGLASTTCGGSIAELGSCVVTISFQPQAIGGTSVTWTPAYVDPYAQTQTLSLALSGTGLADLTGTSLATFPATPVTGIATQTITLSNVASGSVTYGALNLSAPFAARVTSSGACNLAGGTLAAGTACTFYVDFQPTTAGTSTSSFSVAVTDSLGNTAPSLHWNLNGSGFNPAVLGLSSPSSPYTFANTLVNQSTSTNFLLANTGGYTGTILSIAGGTPEFTPSLVSGSSCPIAGCQIKVKFAPTSVTTFGPVTLTITYQDGSNGNTNPAGTGVHTLTFQVSGTGATVANLSWTDTSGASLTQINFGQSVVGASAVTESVWLVNQGNAAAATGIQDTLTGSASFAIASTDCTATLAANSHCTVQLTYTPHLASVGPGVDAGSLSGSYNAGPPLGIVNLPVLTLSASTISTLQIATGLGHSCAVDPLGRLSCWGQNTSGQLGIGSADSSSHPTPIQINLSGKTARSVAVGYQHTCVVFTDNTLKCWGDNSGGQLGLDSTTQMNAPQATSVNIGGAVQSVSAGNLHTCVVMLTGEVKCFGSTQSLGVLGLGTLDNWGDGTNLMASLPSVSLGETNQAIQVSAGYSHTCAVLTNNHLKCWGSNGAGQAGQPSSPAYASLGGSMDTIPSSLSAVNLGTGYGAASVSAGNGFTCAVLDDHSGVKCFGRQGNASLSNGSTQYGNLGTCWSVNSSGQFVNCAQTTNSPLESYGASVGQLGDALAVVDLGTESGTNLSVISVQAGNNHACAQLQTSTGAKIKCWGAGYSGQTGLGLPMTFAVSSQRGATAAQMGSALPFVALNSQETLTGMSAGFDSVCAWFASGKSQCWGSSSTGQLGYGNLTSLNSPGSLVQW